MNIMRKIVLYIKNIFIKQNKVKALQESKIRIVEDKKENFIEQLKTTTIEKRTKKNIEVLICNGDGLGIQKKITC